MEGSPKLVQELVINGRDPPSRYIVKDQDGLFSISSSVPSSPIPVIDLNRLSQSDCGDEVAKLRSALKSWGAFIAVGHGMPSSLLDEVLNMSREFFHLPLEEKQKCVNLTPEKTLTLEGYGTDLVHRDDAIHDWNDRLLLLVQPENQRTLSLWPRIPNSFRDILNEFETKTRSVRDHLLRAMAKSLDLNEDCFINKFDENALSYARFNYCPPCTRPDQVLGIGPHSDSSVLTFLLIEKNVAGLQVYKDEEWVDVSTLPYSLLVNLGDIMEVMSNGIFKSPVHRVLTNSAKERLSVALFYVLDPDKEFEPVDGLIDEERPRMYKTVKTRDFLATVSKNFDEPRKSVQSLKVEAQE